MHAVTQSISVAVIGVLSLAGAVRAEPAEASAATTRPSPPPDVARDAVDPYNPAGERGRFFKAAGVDNELDANEFAADRKRDGGLIRAFDRWDAAAGFDKDGNKTLDWFEFDAYRRDLRGRVMKAYDADKDGRLRRRERTEANTALAAGKVPAAPKSKRPTGAPAGSDVAQRRAAWRERMRRAMERRYDADGDGQLNEQETAAMEAARAEREQRLARYREQAEQRRRQRVAEYDTDGDGQLNDEERRAMVEQMRRRYMLRRYDADRDGQLDAEEQAAMEAARARREQRMAEYRRRAADRRRELEAEYDADGDGELNDDERTAMREGLRERYRRRAAAMRQRMGEMRTEADADGDGETTREEWGEYWRDLRDRYDSDKDGRLDGDERREMMRELYGGDGGGGMTRVIRSEDGRSTVVVHTIGAGGREGDE